MKRGEESGYIKITLRGDHRKEHINIMRKISTNNKSEWLLNGGLKYSRRLSALNAIIILTVIVILLVDTALRTGKIDNKIWFLVLI